MVLDRYDSATYLVQHGVSATGLTNFYDTIIKKMADVDNSFDNS